MIFFIVSSAPLHVAELNAKEQTLGNKESVNSTPFVAVLVSHCCYIQKYPPQL